MTQDDYADFSQAYTRMATSLSTKPPTTDAITTAYADASAFPLPVVLGALDKIRTTSRFMPRPVQLIDACHDAARSHASNGGYVPEWVNHNEDRYFCTVCQDTGFERDLECDGTGYCRIGRCGQNEDADHVKIQNDPHLFTRRCACRPTNPVLAQFRDATRRPADAGRDR